MTEAKYLAARRQRLMQAVGGPIVLMGHGPLARNYPANTYPFRQDSSFLYYTGCNRPGAVALLTPEKGLELFVPEPHEDEALWHGPQEGLRELGERLGAEHVHPRSEAPARLEKLRSAGAVHTVPVADPAALAELRSLTGCTLVPGAAGGQEGSERLVEAIVEQRLSKAPEELEQMRLAARVTLAAHREARALCRPGTTERQIASRVRSVFFEHACEEAYTSIVTVRGEVLHCHDYSGTLAPGQMLLIDAGAESPVGYAADVTRTFPVSGRFDPLQRDLYELVLAAQEACIAMCRPGVSYRDVHTEACRVLAAGLCELGFLRGKPEDLLEQGAHAVFFPHGIGHPLGLDTHELRTYGTRAGWAAPLQKDERPGKSGASWTLGQGMVFTVEPGLYFSPTLVHRAQYREWFRGLVDFERAERHLGLGGIRIEDDVLVTAGGPEVLSAAIPKQLAEIER
jgi:Xaa-Pro aminopeptidase